MNNNSGRFYVTLTLCALCVNGVSAAPKQKKEGKTSRPNIIFLMDDQHRWDALGVVNNQIITPTLDKLAAEGVHFNNAVCQAPMSVASRYSMMTGLYAEQNGVRRNEPGIKDEDMPAMVMAELMQAVGYETAGFGKTHWTVMCGTRGFETRYEAECREEGAVMMVDVDKESYNRYKAETAPFGDGEEDPAGYVGMISQLEEREHRDGWLTEKCLDYLDERDDDRPLFLYLSFFKPHAAHNLPAEAAAKYRAEDFEYAKQPTWDCEKSPHAAGNNRNKMYESFWKNASVEQWQTMTMRYYANCTWMDDMFGRVMAKLEQKGLLENSIIIYVADHGEMLGERYYRFNKYCLYESSVRVPMIISGSALPSKFKGKVDRRAAELVDVLPTMLNIVDIEKPDELLGLDLLSSQKRDGSFTALYVSDPTKAAYMWRSEDYKLILSFKRRNDVTQYTEADIVSGEFYNLKEDPEEWNNEFDNSKYNRLKKRMQGQLMKHLLQLKPLGADEVQYNL